MLTLAHSHNQHPYIYLFIVPGEWSDWEAKLLEGALLSLSFHGSLLTAFSTNMY